MVLSESRFARRQAQPFPDALDNPFSQARQVRCGLQPFNRANLVRSGCPGLPGLLGLLPAFALPCFEEFVVHRGIIQHAILLFGSTALGSSTGLLRTLPGDHLAHGCHPYVQYAWSQAGRPPKTRKIPLNIPRKMPRNRLPVWCRCAIMRSQERVLPPPTDRK